MINIRKFVSKDAEFCFKTRANAFIQKFYGELSPEAVAAGVNAYMPNDYKNMAKKSHFFIVEEDSKAIAFFNIRRVDLTTAELPLIYIDLDHLGRGLGTYCIKYIENWLAENTKETRKLIVDTVIPEYNSRFYQKIGFVPEKETECHFPDLTLKAQRLIKKL